MANLSLQDCLLPFLIFHFLLAALVSFKKHCASFDLDRVNSLHSSWYGVMFWVCAENSVDNTGMF